MTRQEQIELAEWGKEINHRLWQIKSRGFENPESAQEYELREKKFDLLLSTLREQPPAGEFTKKAREILNKYCSQVPTHGKGVICKADLLEADVIEYFAKACDKLDSLELQLAEAKERSEVLEAIACGCLDDCCPNGYDLEVLIKEEILKAKKGE